jgi:hypothetical protein
MASADNPDNSDPLLKDYYKNIFYKVFKNRFSFVSSVRKDETPAFS